MLQWQHASQTVTSTWFITLLQDLKSTCLRFTNHIISYYANTHRYNNNNLRVGYNNDDCKKTWDFEPSSTNEHARQRWSRKERGRWVNHKTWAHWSCCDGPHRWDYSYMMDLFKIGGFMENDLLILYRDEEDKLLKNVYRSFSPPRRRRKAWLSSLKELLKMTWLLCYASVTWSRNRAMHMLC